MLDDRPDQVDSIARIAAQLEIAREEGLLTPLLAGDRDPVVRLACERIALLSARIRWVYPPPSPESSQTENEKASADSVPAVIPYTVLEP